MIGYLGGAVGGGMLAQAAADGADKIDLSEEDKKKLTDVRIPQRCPRCHPTEK